MKSRLYLATLIGIIFNLMPLSKVVASTFSFSKIAETNSFFSDLGTINAPSINDSGKVAFFGTLNNGVDGIFIGDGVSPITTVIDNSGSINPRFGGIINNNDSVAFIGTDAGFTTSVFTIIVISI